MSDGKNSAEKDEEEEMKREEEERLRLQDIEDEVFYASLPGWRRWFKEFTASGKAFEMFITGVILANVTCMAIEHYDQPRDLTISLEVFNNLFSFIFFLEFVFKLLGHGPIRY